jgi:holo-[acyl-carrier protein] synthase
VIVGIGTDAVEIGRIARALDRHPGFAARVFTKREQAAAERRGAGAVAYFAKRWAAKEATSKALGVGFSGFRYTEIEVLNLPSGAPTAELSGELAAWARTLGVERLHLTLTDTRLEASAMVIAEAAGVPPDRPATPPPWVLRRLRRQRVARAPQAGAG